MNDIISLSLALMTMVVAEAKKSSTSKRGDPKDANTLSPTPTTFTSTTTNPTPQNFVAGVDLTHAPTSAPTAAPLTDWQIGLISVAALFVFIIILGTWYRMTVKSYKKDSEVDPLMGRPMEDPAGEDPAGEVTSPTWTATHEGGPTVVPGPPPAGV